MVGEIDSPIEPGQTAASTALVSFCIGLCLAVVCATWPFVHLLSENTDVAFHYPKIARYGAVLVAAIAGLYVPAAFLFRRIGFIRFGVILGAGVICFFMYGAITEVFELLLGKDGHAGKLALGFIVTLFAGIALMVGRASQERRLAKITATLLLILYAGPAIGLTTDASKISRQLSSGGSGMDDAAQAAKQVVDPQIAHNVYYFVLDMYARQDVLETYFGIDNKPFLANLERLGFAVDRQSLSNYGTTVRTISTAFNMDFYIPDSGDYEVEILQTGGRAAEAFHKRGYSFYFVESGGFEAITCGRQVDYCVKGSRVDQVGRLLLTMTPLWRLAHSGFVLKTFATEGMYSLSEIEPAVSEILDYGRGRGPYLAFVHILSPHGPARYSPDCERLTILSPKFGDNDRRRYTHDLGCLNPRILSAMKNILANDHSDPIILLQSDHGVRRELVGEPDGKLIRIKNLSATRAPQRCRDLLNQRLTPVNNFRFALACIDDTKPAYIEDRFFQLAYPDKDHLLDFTDIVRRKSER